MVIPMKMHRWFSHLLWRHGGKLLLCIIFAVAAGFSSTMIRMLAGDAVERFGQGHASFRFLWGAAVAVILYLICAGGLARCRRLCASAVSANMDAIIQRHAAQMHLDENQQVTEGTLTTLVTQDKRLVMMALERILMRILPDCCLWVAGVIAIGQISLWLALISMLLSALTVLWFAVWSKALHVRQDDYLQELETLNTQSAASLASLEISKAWHDEGNIISRSDKQTDLVLGTARRIHRTESMISIPSTACAFLILLGIVFTAGLLCVSGRVTTGQALAAVLLVDAVCNPAMSMDNSIRAIRRSQAALGRLSAFLEESGEMEDGLLKPMHQDRPGLTLENVSFSYDHEKPILCGFSHEFVPGHPYCISGANGSGKSTLFYLIAGVLTPTHGTICAGSDIAVCTQDICTFGASIRDNICAGRPWDPAKLERITRAIGIHDEILQTQHGYDTILGENGEPLSRGQRQRLSICRTLYQDAEIMLFDEPTSALDPAHTATFFQYIEAEARSKTILLISHDPVESAGFETVYLEVNP